MLLSRFRALEALAAFCFAAFAYPASSATVLVLEFHNSSSHPDLAWVGESIAQTLNDELSAQGQITFNRETRAEALRRLDLRPGADYTKATLIRLGQSLGVEFVCYGAFDAALPTGDADLKHSTIQVSAHFLDLRKLHAGPDFAEAGKLVDLARAEEHLAWQSLRYLNPGANLPVDKFLAPAKLIRVEAQESYTRGLLSTNKDQQARWFAQALALDPHFSNPAYELGVLALDRKDPRQAITWFNRISSTADPHYAPARFKLGLAAYAAGDFNLAANCFRDLSKGFPLNEVFNNLGAAEAQLNLPAAAEDFRRAAEGDPHDPVYLFNQADALLKENHFDDASARLQELLSRAPDDDEAQTLLGRSQRHEFTSASGKPPAPFRLKSNFDGAALQQSKAGVQPKSSE